MLAALARPTPAATVFVEQRASGLLAEPLLLAGRLSHPRAGALVKQVDSPYQEHTSIAGGRVEMERRSAGEAPQRRRFSLRHAPELAGLLAGFEGVLAGDRRLLERHFVLSLQGDGDGRWSLRMRPRDARLARRIKSLDLHGEAGSLACMEVLDVDGDGSRMLVGPAAERLLAARAAEDADGVALADAGAVGAALDAACAAPVDAD